MDSKPKKRKYSEENREFNSTWDSFAFTANSAGLPVCLICGETLANNNKSNLERHFHNKHTPFAEKYPAGDERIRAISVLLRKEEQSKCSFQNWIKSPNSTTAASIVASHEIIRRGNPFTDGEYIKESFIKISERLFSDFRNKTEIVQKIKDMPLSKDCQRKNGNKHQKWQQTSPVSKSTTLIHLQHTPLPAMSQVM